MVQKRRMKRSIARMQDLEKLLKVSKFKQKSDSLPEDFVQFKLENKTGIKDNEIESEIKAK